MNVIINEYGNLEYFKITPIFRKLIDEVMRHLAAESAYEKQIVDAYEHSEIISTEFTGNGFYVSFSSEIPPDPVFFKIFPFGNTHGSIEECQVGYLLFFRDGKISTLECCCYSDTGEYPFPRMEDIREFLLIILFELVRSPEILRCFLDESTLEDDTGEGIYKTL